ncbi:MAG: hypothetical protein ACK58T_02740, partial [Phycisphaerae bacterium]
SLWSTDQRELTEFRLSVVPPSKGQNSHGSASLTVVGSLVLDAFGEYTSRHADSVMGHRHKKTPP